MDLIKCRGCGLPIPVRSAACWRCDYPVVFSLAPQVGPNGGLSALAQGIVAVSVFAVLLVGMVTFHARNEAILSDVGEAPPPPPAVVAGNVPGPRPAAPTPRASPTSAQPTATPSPPPVLPAQAAVIDQGGWAVVNADNLLIRTQPHRDVASEIVGAYDAGAFVEVLDGPVVGSGYYWFLVEGDGPTGWVAAGTAAGAWLVRSDAPGTMVSLPAGSISVSGADVVYYDIVGTSPAQLREQISRFGPQSDPGTDVIATAEFVPAWVDVPIAETIDVGGILTTSSYYVCDVSWSFVVTVPRWVAPASVPQPTAAWWDVALNRIAEHEATHVRIWQEALPRLEARLSDQMPCWEATDAIYAWLYEVDAAQAAFDADHGYLDWPSAPSIP